MASSLAAKVWPDRKRTGEVPRRRNRGERKQGRLERPRGGPPTCFRDRLLIQPDRFHDLQTCKWGVQRATNPNLPVKAGALCPVEL